MTKLLEDALAVARGGFASAQRERIDLRAPLSGIVEDRSLGSAGLRAELGEAPLWINAEPGALRRLFGNLIYNALNYAPHCVVRLRRDGEATVFVDDDGPGIPEAARASVFDPFFRLDASRSRSTGGSGARACHRQADRGLAWGEYRPWDVARRGSAGERRVSGGVGVDESPPIQRGRPTSIVVRIPNPGWTSR
jgi:light-regulated signal transduction histidine kinase (bacteriophytochrome)